VALLIVLRSVGKKSFCRVANRMTAGLAEVRSVTGRMAARLSGL